MGSNHFFGHGMILQVGHYQWGERSHVQLQKFPIFVGGGFNMFQIFFKFHPYFGKIPIFWLGWVVWIVTRNMGQKMTIFANS